MADDPMPMGDKITAASLLIRLLGLLERLLPAALVAWNNSLREKNKRLELRNAALEVKAEVEEKRHELEEFIGSAAETIDRVLDRRG